MTLEEYLKEVKERCSNADKAICDVAQDSNKFKMCVPPEPDDTDVLVTDICRQDVPALVEMLKKAIKDRDYYINTKWPAGGIAQPMIEVATEELESLIPTKEGE